MMLCLTMMVAVVAVDLPRPNIVLIMADDLGYECLSCNGSTSYQTPHLDRLAAHGVRFTHCYAQPLCTPTRVQLMTGQSNARNYINFGTLDRQAKTFGHLFAQAGYATGVVGKWQLGREVDSPQHFGFQESCLWQHTRRPPRYANPGLEVSGVEKDYTDGEYGPTLVNDFALDFITRHREQPFFLYYPMILTHSPFQPTPDSDEWDAKAKGEAVNNKPKHFAAMVAYMDKMVGRLANHLDELGLANNTLILFLGDNGTGRGLQSRMGDEVVHGGKGLTTRAGMHVPLVAYWPAAITEARACNDLVDTTDFLPTLAAAAGIPIPADWVTDGVSFLPQLLNRAETSRPWIYSWYERDGKVKKAQAFAFDQHYKLYRDGRFFDLTADAAEKRPLEMSVLTAEQKEAAAKLRAAIASYQHLR